MGYLHIFPGIITVYVQNIGLSPIFSYPLPWVLPLHAAFSGYARIGKGLAETRIPRKHPGPRQNGTVPERAGVQDGFLSGTPCTSNRFLRPLNRPCGVQDASYEITPCTSERKKPLADRRNLPVLRRLNGSLVSICFLPNVVL